MVKGWLEVSATPVEEGGRERGEMRESLLVSHSKGVPGVREGGRGREGGREGEGGRVSGVREGERGTEE